MFYRFRDPFFCPDKRSINETLRQIDLPSPVEILCKRFKNLSQRSAPHPGLISTVTSLVWRIPLWQIKPTSAGAKNPQYPVENLPIPSPGSTAPVRSTLKSWNMRFDFRPLLVCQFFVSRHKYSMAKQCNFRYYPFMRWLLVTSSARTSCRVSRQARNNKYDRLTIQMSDRKDVPRTQQFLA